MISRWIAESGDLPQIGETEVVFRGLVRVRFQFGHEFVDTLLLLFCIFGRERLAVVRGVLQDFGAFDVEGLVLVGVGLLGAVGGELVGDLGHGADVVLA